MPASIQGQLRRHCARLPPIPLDVNPGNTIADVSRRLREKILKYNFRRHIHGSDSDEHERKERPAQAPAACHLEP
jgi:hypothetical protein